MYKQSDLSDESMLSSRNDLSDESMLCNQNSLSDKELLIVHYGVADKAGRRQSLNAIADVLKMIFPDYEVQQAFSSQRVIDRIKNQEGVDIKSVKMALDEAASNHVRSLVVLPTYIISGIEYHSLLEIVHAYEEKFVSIKMCKPMLTEKDDFNITADAIAAYASCYDDEQTAICLMGHGTTDAANEAYLRLQSTFNDKNYVNYYVGTKCASPMAKDIL